MAEKAPRGVGSWSEAADTFRHPAAGVLALKPRPCGMSLAMLGCHSTCLVWSSRAHSSHTQEGKIRYFTESICLSLSKNILYIFILLSSAGTGMAGMRTREGGGSLSSEDRRVKDFTALLYAL